MDNSSSSDDDDTRPTEIHRNEDEGSENEDEAQNELSEREAFREKISTMSFEDLQKLKTKIGLKVFDRVVHGTTHGKAPQTDFKRANKNRPREMSSKAWVRAGPSKSKNNPKSRDPRFDSLCGEFDKKTFKSNYKFLKEVKGKERKELDKAFKKEKNPIKKKKMQLLMQRLDNQNREEEKQDTVTKEKVDEMKEIKKTLRKGEKPVFKKKSEKRLDDLVKKYDELKKTNKLQKHFKRQNQKLMKKDRNLNNFLE